MMKQSLNLSSLIDFVYQSLASTEEIKNILRCECDEAKFVLKPWLMETSVMKEVNEDSCTCDKTSSVEDQIEEIASGIDRAVLQAQQLREKLAINVSKEKKRSCAPDVRNIYMPGTISPVESTSKKVPSLRKDTVVRQSVKSNDEKENGRKNCNVNSSDRSSERTSKNAQQRYGTTKKLLGPTLMDSTLKGKLKSKTMLVKPLKELPSAVHKDIVRAKKFARSKSVTDNKLLKPSPYNTLVTKPSTKSKAQKNFVVANIKSVKRKESGQLSKSMVHLKPGSPNNSAKESDAVSSMNERKSLISDYKASTTELNELISKMSLESIKNSSVPYLKEEYNHCPFHGNSASKFIEKRVTMTVDIVEGLDRLGVPSELVKTLKVYHNYLKQELSGESPLHNRKQRAIDKFLLEFETMNDARQNRLKTERLSNLTTSFISLLKESHGENMDFISASKLKVKYTDLDSVYKLYNVKNLDVTKIARSTIVESTSQDYLRNLRGWRSNGIWNDASIMSFEGMSRVLCIRYANKNQLLSLIEAIQRLQRTQYLNNIINLLLTDVIPEVHRVLDPASKEYAEAYKMISIISQVLNPKIPVLVRTDK